MCKNFTEFITAYKNFEKNNTEKNSVIMDLERQNWDLTAENHNLENSIASKDMLISLYKTQVKSLERQIENERTKYKNRITRYKKRTDISIIAVCVLFLVLEIVQFIIKLH